MSRKFCRNSFILAAKIFSHSGDSLFLFPFFILISLFNISQLASQTWPIVVGMAATGIIVWSIKTIVRKDRPKGSHGKIYRKTDPYSFPSGHAARVFTIVGISLFDPVYQGIIITAWALMVSLSRIVLKLHYWKDIIAGSGLGILVGVIFYLITRSF